MALEEALQIQRESEIISMTGWTFEQYDQQPAGRLARMMTYISLKNGVEKSQLDKGGGGGSGLTGR